MIPRDVPLRERSKYLSTILFDEQNQSKSLQLRIGRAGVWSVARDTSIEPKLTLRTSTYTLASRSWASVSPVILDRMPKIDRTMDPVGWREEVASIIALSCANVGLPEPIEIRVEKTPFFIGRNVRCLDKAGFRFFGGDAFKCTLRWTLRNQLLVPLLSVLADFAATGSFVRGRSHRNDAHD